MGCRWSVMRRQADGHGCRQVPYMQAIRASRHRKAQPEREGGRDGEDSGQPNSTTNRYKNYTQQNNPSLPTLFSSLKLRVRIQR